MTTQTVIRWPWCKTHKELLTLTHAHVLHKEDPEAWVELDKVMEGVGQTEVEQAMADINLPPGTIIGKGTGAPRKIPWTKQLMEDGRYKMVTFIPPTAPTGGVTINGVNYRWKAGEEVTVPEIVKQVYMESYNAAGKEHEGTGAQKLANVGPMEPDRFVER